MWDLVRPDTTPLNQQGQRVRYCRTHQTFHAVQPKWQPIRQITRAVTGQPPRQISPQVIRVQSPVQTQTPQVQIDEAALVARLERSLDARLSSIESRLTSLESAPVAPPPTDTTDLERRIGELEMKSTKGLTQEDADDITQRLQSFVIENPDLFRGLPGNTGPPGPANNKDVILTVEITAPDGKKATRQINLTKKEPLRLNMKVAK